ncbi:MAG: host-nuclease inhibitor Gam family protein [Gammaproteobacteria bacterium]|nr:host-nuclease inhibitor Gam family protein [Gammaproteobacteria bacterium]
MEATRPIPMDPRDEELNELFEQAGDELPISPVDVDDEVDAERHMESLERLEHDLRKLRNHREAMIRRATDWYETQSRTLERRKLWHFESLKFYLHLLGKKSLKLIGGTLKVTAGRESMKMVDAEGNEVKDPAVFIAWAKANKRDDLICTKIVEEPDIKAIKKSGIMPPGIKVVTGESKFSIKLSGSLEDDDDRNDS